MSMSKRDYEAIAQVLLSERTAIAVREQVRTAIARQLAGMMATDNAMFDRTRFLKACGVSE
jgi:hypothetical protein